jgi:hypothetical protein
MRELIELQRMLDAIDPSDPEFQKRLAVARDRQRAFDEKIERQVALKAPSQELLNKTCSI